MTDLFSGGNLIGEIPIGVTTVSVQPQGFLARLVSRTGAAVTGAYNTAQTGIQNTVAGITGYAKTNPYAAGAIGVGAVGAVGAAAYALRRALTAEQQHSVSQVVNAVNAASRTTQTAMNSVARESTITGISPANSDVTILASNAGAVDQYGTAAIESLQRFEQTGDSRYLHQSQQYAANALKVATNLDKMAGQVAGNVSKSNSILAATGAVAGITNTFVTPRSLRKRKSASKKRRSSGSKSKKPRKSSSTRKRRTASGRPVTARTAATFLTALATRAVPKRRRSTGAKRKTTRKSKTTKRRASTSGLRGRNRRSS